jgi:hypothetical protein
MGRLNSASAACSDRCGAWEYFAGESILGRCLRRTAFAQDSEVAALHIQPIPLLAGELVRHLDVDEKFHRGRGRRKRESPRVANLAHPENRRPLIAACMRKAESALRPFDSRACSRCSSNASGGIGGSECRVNEQNSCPLATAASYFPELPRFVGPSIPISQL